MNCNETQSELVPYHFGEIKPATRYELEIHLLECPECLGDFLALKRAIETAASEKVPSRAARERLREAVALKVRPRSYPREWRWWERLVVMLCAGATVAAALFILQIITTDPGTMPYTLSKQTRAASIQVR